MKKGFKKLAVSALLIGSFSLAFVACKDSDKDDKTGGEDTPVSFVITADNIIGITSDDQVDFVGAGTVGLYSDTTIAKVKLKNKGFSMPLPNLQDKYLQEFSMEDIPIGVIVSDTSAKTMGIDIIAERNGRTVGSFSYRSADFNARVVYMYTDRAFSMKGKIEISESFTDITFTYIDDYNISLKKGWNILVMQSTTVTTADKIVITRTYSPTISSGLNLNWYYEPSEYDFDYTESANQNVQKALPKIFKKIK